MDVTFPAVRCLLQTIDAFSNSSVPFVIKVTKVRKAGDPGNHSFAIFPTVIILLWLLHENEVFDLVYDRSVYLNSSSKDTILHIVTTIKQESTFCVRYMFLYFSNV
uniref:Uncharacterized protein n=1 Tax=Lactuca sativa TaxID=4236 RepID=A0A9R1XQV7_LACSA|nr:hypothetical protein LSAT_V11C200099970 [Lactuca sativa]